jgi:hypothetical protein
MHQTTEALAQTVSGLAVVSDEEADAWERSARRVALRATWERVPRGLLKGRAHPALEAAAANWTPDHALALLGPTGSGKTVSTARIVARICKAGADNGGDELALAKSTFWIDEPELMWAAQNRDDPAAQRLIHRAHRCRVLVLDDLSQPSKTLHSVLQTRCKHKRVCVVTCGATTRDEFAEMIGAQAPFRWFMESGEGKGRFAIGERVRAKATT